MAKAKQVAVTIFVPEQLIEAIPDILRIMQARDENGYFEDIHPMESNGTLQRMAEERYDSVKNPKFSREIGVAMIASSLIDEAIDAIVAATIKGVVQ